MKTTLWYITANEYELLTLSVKTMAALDWVTSIVILHTDLKQPAYYANLENTLWKVKEFWQSFGSGFDKPVEQGGFDEIAARNRAIELAEAAGSDWIIQCDSDEFYTADANSGLVEATEKNKQAVRWSCWHLFNPTYSIFDPASIHYYDGQLFHDPHIRAWKPELRLRYQANPNTDFLSNFINKSMHCVNLLPEWQTLNQPGIFHLHIHDLIGNKRRFANFPKTAAEAKHIDIILPGPYLEAWKLEPKTETDLIFTPV